MFDRLLSKPLVYRAWQAPFVKQKLKPFQARFSSAAGRRVIDVGCGPGTNANLFPPDSYVGVDLNEDYVLAARRRFKHRFEVWDVTKPGPDLGKFDIALINSVFHHLSDEETVTVLSGLKSFLNPGAELHILDLVLPADRSLARALAQLDRGDYPRSDDHWLDLFGNAMSISHFEHFDIGLFGTRMWDMIYVLGAFE